jgi:hypothetical protein
MMGEIYRNRALPKDLDFGRTAIIVVTGTSPNTCGHALLYIGGGLGHYFQFNGPTLFDYPTYLGSDSNYRSFLSSEGKRELLRRHYGIPKPEKAAARLSELLNGKWLSLLVSHNCAAFAVNVIRAGGNSCPEIPDHCPVLDLGWEALMTAVFKPIREAIGTQKRYEARCPGR